MQMLVIVKKVLQQLIPPDNLEDLHVGGSFGGRYFTWNDATHLSSVNFELDELQIMCDRKSQLPNMRYLEIITGENDLKLWAFAFPRLCWLVINDMT